MKNLYNLLTQCARRTLFLHKTTLLLLATLTLSSNAWGQQYNSGTWYSLYDANEYNASTADVRGVTVKTYSAFAPNTGAFSFKSKLPGNASSYSSWSTSSSDPKSYDYGVEGYTMNFGNVSDISVNHNVSVTTGTREHRKNILSGFKNQYRYPYSYTYNYTSISRTSGLDTEATSIAVNYNYKLKNTLRTVYISTVAIPLAKHIRLDNGTDAGTTSISKTFNNTPAGDYSEAIAIDFRSFLTNGNITVTLTSGDKEVFRLGSTSNTTGAISQSAAGKNYSVGSNACASKNGTEPACASGKLGNIANYAFNVYFCPKAGTTYNGTITITDGTSTATVSLTGTGDKLTPVVDWSSNDEIFNEEDVLTATNENDLTVTLSSTGNESYVNCDGNTATMLAATSGKITITAHVTGNDIYKDVDVEKQITITSLIKQYITWEQESLAHLKLPATPTTITLDARASSNLPVTYTLYGNKTGLTLTKVSDTKWTLTYSVECKNTTIVATQGGNAEYAPASAMSIPVKVIDPSKECGTDETWIQTSTTMKDESKTQNIEIPSSLTIKLKKTKEPGLFVWYLGGFKVEFFTQKDGKGTAARTETYSADQIGTSETTFDITDLDVSYKSVKITSEATNGYDVTSVTYTKQKYCNLSASSLSFTTCPKATATAKTIDVSYANYPLSVTCSNSKFTYTPTDFGDCGEYGKQSISINYTAGEDEGDDVGYLYITDNTGNMQRICTLNVAITKIPQHITSTDIATSYNTTDKVQLHSVASSELTDFEYSATPEGVAVFNGSEMTFLKAGTIAITVKQPGSVSYASTSKTIENVVVSAVTPTVAEQPTGVLTCNGTFDNSSLTGGKAIVTLHSVENSQVAGHFEWVNADEDVTVVAGTYNYDVKFVPDNDKMYNTTTFSLSTTVNLAESTLEIANGTTVVSMPEDGAELDLMSLINRSNEAEMIYAVTSDNAAFATINGNKFSASEVGNYTIHATMAATDYYTGNEANFAIKVNEGITFQGDAQGQWTEENSPSATDRVIVSANVDVVGAVSVGSLTINAEKTVTIKNNGALTVGDKNSLSRSTYGNIIIEAGGKLILNEGEVHLNEFTLQSTFDSENPMSGQVINQNKLIMHGDAYFVLDLDPSGEASPGWYDFTVPFPVDELNGITRLGDNGEWQTIVNERNYAVMDFHEELFAQGKSGWKKYTGILQPGRGYTMTIDCEINTYRFKMAENGVFNSSMTQALQASAGGVDNHLGWNSVGNGTMSYVSFENAPSEYVQLYDHAERKYVPVRCTDKTFVVGASYFIQAEDGATIDMEISDVTSDLLRAPQRVQNDDICRVDLSLTYAGKVADYMFITCRDDAQPTYTIGKDVAKMGETSEASTARIWSNAKGANLCAVDVAYNDNQAIIPLNIKAPKAGEYAIAMDSNPAEEVYLRQDGIIVWNMAMGEYYAYLTAGTDSSYDLLVIRHRAPNTATGIDAIDGDNDNNGTIFVEKMIVNGQLYILRDGTLYDAQGKKVTNL